MNNPPQSRLVEIADESKRKELLMQTGLDIVLAVAGDEGAFNAAHGETMSVLVLKIDDILTVWQWNGDSKQFRKDGAARVREMLCRECGGKMSICYDPQAASQKVFGQ